MEKQPWYSRHRTKMVPRAPVEHHALTVFLKHPPATWVLQVTIRMRYFEPGFHVPVDRRNAGLLRFGRRCLQSDLVRPQIDLGPLDGKQFAFSGAHVVADYQQKAIAWIPG